MPEELRPDKCGVMFEAYHAEQVVVAQVEPGRPDAWKSDEPRKLIDQMIRDRYVVWVLVGKIRYLFLPEGTTEADARKRAEKAYKRALAA
jgi:hypothetical protein